MARTNEWTETLVDWVDGRLRQTRFSNLWLGGGAGPNGGANYRPVDGQLTQRSVCYDTSEDASPCSPSGFSSLVDNLRRIRYWQEPATWFGLETTSGLKVTIKPGLWYPSTTEYCAFAGGDSPTFTLPGALDRIDTVYVDASGVLHIQRGTPAVSPTITLPPISSGIPLWAVYLPPTASGIYFQTCSGYYTGQGYIERDLRPFLNLGGTAASGVLPAGTAEGQTLITNAALEWVADTTPLWKGEHSFEGGISILTGQGITMADETWIGIGVGAERIIFDTAGDICVMGASFGIGVNPPDMDLHVHGANSVTIKLTNDDTGISGNVGLDIGVASDESAYMWNRENTELSFGTNNLRRATILANGKIGFNTATIPHGAVGAALFALEGTDVSADGPHVQFTTDNDDYPLLQLLLDKHDAVHIVFDAYYDYASWKSSDLGSNCQIHKEGDQIQISYDSNVGQGNNITWNTGLVMNLNNGHVGIAESTPGGKLDIAWGGTGTYMTLQLGADSSASTRTNVTNKYVHMGAYHYTNIEEPIGMMYVASTSLVSRLDIGGGSGLLNAATEVSVYTATNTITTTGTKQLEINSTYFAIDPTGSGIKVGIGTATPTGHLHITDMTVSTTTHHYGIYSYHIKTAGVTTEADDIYGVYNVIDVNHNGSTVGNIIGTASYALLTDGTVGDGQESLQGGVFMAQLNAGTVNKDVIGTTYTIDLNAGTVAGNVVGLLTFVDIEPGVTSIGGNVYGIYMSVDADTNPAGSVYMIYLVENTGVDYGIYQNGTADNYFGGSIIINELAGGGNRPISVDNTGKIIIT